MISAVVPTTTLDPESESISLIGSAVPPDQTHVDAMQRLDELQQVCPDLATAMNDYYEAAATVMDCDVFAAFQSDVLVAMQEQEVDRKEVEFLRAH